MESARCWACNRLFQFDATLVPRANGAPLCRLCVARVNELLTEAGHVAVEIKPGTYTEDA